MKTGPSSLNPNAASYVPLFKRGVAENRPEHASIHGQHPNISQSHVLSPGATRAAEFTIWKDHRGGEFHASTSHYPNMVPEKSYFDDFDMDLAYLQMTFPGISEQSLSDVYLANICDLDAAVDMIHQLEIQLPDTLDIGDVPEPGSTSKVESKVKSPTAEKGASTSH